MSLTFKKLFQRLVIWGAAAYICSAVYCAAAPTLPKAPFIAPQVAKEWLNQGKGITFVDVRASKEYSAGHIADAVNLPYDQVEKHTNEFNKSYPLIFYCTYSAWRAPYAANTLADLGCKNVYVLEGGISAWRAGGQTIYAIDSNQPANVIPYPVIPYEGLSKTLKHPRGTVYKKKLNFTLEELSHYDGQDGRPAYAAVNGVIYDLTQSRLWRGGVHDPSHGMATAGRDLTEVIKKSPHGTKTLKNFPVVGKLIVKK